MRRDALRRQSSLEREARRLGMVKAGERMYVVEGLPKPLASLGSGAVRHRPRPVGGGPPPPRASPADQRPVLERVRRQIQAELRRRLGGPFTTQELADLYDEGTGWAPTSPTRSRPDHPDAWDIRVVGDAAFASYLREATDYPGASGGRWRLASAVCG